MCAENYLGAAAFSPCAHHSFLVIIFLSICRCVWHPNQYDNTRITTSYPSSCVRHLRILYCHYRCNPRFDSKIIIIHDQLSFKPVVVIPRAQAADLRFPSCHDHQQSLILVPTWVTITILIIMNMIQLSLHQKIHLIQV